MEARQVGTKTQCFPIFSFGLWHLAQDKIIFSERLMRAGGVRMRGDKCVDGALGEQSTGVAEVIQQIRVVGPLSEGGIEVRDRFAQLTGFDLRDSQGVLCAYPLEVRDGLGGVPLSQKRVAKILMTDGKVGAQFEPSLQRSDGRTVIVLLHVRRAEIHEGIGEPWVEFRSLAKLRDLYIHLMLLACLQACAKMLCRRIGRHGLPRKQSK